MSKVAPDLSSVTVVGLDLAKHVFQVHCVDDAGKVILNRSLKRREVLDFFHRLPMCRVGLEACGSSHHWGRHLLALGHDVKLIPPAYVKPYVKLCSPAHNLTRAFFDQSGSYPQELK